jgi:SMODS-associated and fused to various effectors sensor domain
MTSPLPTPSATGVRTAGDRFQWLIAWQGCLTALREAAVGAENPVLAVGVEVDDVGNLDDVVLYRRHPPHTYQQVKYAVDDRVPVNTDYLTAPSRSGGPSILRKIALAWRHLSQPGEPIELALITNRTPDSDDPLIAGRDARTRLLLPSAEHSGPNSARGKARAAWAAAAELTEAELLELLGVLHFDLARNRSHLEEITKLTMLVAGLRGDDQALAAGADWVAAQVVAGHRTLDLTAINHAVEARDLRSGPPRSIVSIATLKPDPLAAQAHYALDWVDRFDGADAYQKRRPKPPATWQRLQDDIDTIPTRVSAASHVVVTGSLRLASAFAVGAALRMVTNTDVAVVQRGALWNSDAPYEAPITPTISEYEIEQGDDLAVAVEVATPIVSDVLRFLRDMHIPAHQLIVVAPPGGARDNAVCGPGDACALAVGIRDVVRRLLPGHPKVHLFLAGPMGLALLLGHRWNRVAPTVIYEDLSALGYEAAFTVSA